MEAENKKRPFTEEDFYHCQWAYRQYFIDVLNGDYDLDQAREDLRGLIGSEWDSRTKQIKTT